MGHFFENLLQVRSGRAFLSSQCCEIWARSPMSSVFFGCRSGQISASGCEHTTRGGGHKIRSRPSRKERICDRI